MIFPERVDTIKSGTLKPFKKSEITKVKKLDNEVYFLALE
jgi:hypothetical protein